MIDGKTLDASIETAAAHIKNADHLLILAGAGMGVDSGLPDFRGNEGFWNAYPPFRDRGLSFYDLANPVWFETDPAQAWGFYGHRLNLYRATAPHVGFEMLLRWAKTKKSYFVFTSNVDGHFSKSGFDSSKIIECHGSFSKLQCRIPCSNDLWPSDDIGIDVDPETFIAGRPLPTCPNCNAIARPNILMFGDAKWLSSHADRQLQRYDAWFNGIRTGEKLTMIEIGAGSAVPTVRHESERRLMQPNASLIRINPRESEGPSASIPIPLTGMDGLSRLRVKIEEFTDAQ